MVDIYASGLFAAIDALNNRNKYTITSANNAEFDIYIYKHLGTISFNSENVKIYAKPFWENCKGIRIEFINNEEHETASLVLDFPLTGDSLKDASKFFAIMSDFLSKLIIE